MHPTQKPVALMSYLIETYSGGGGSILDPFTGSGTTGVACIKTGRTFIGIEIDETYCEIAAKRLRRAEADRGELLPMAMMGEQVPGEMGVHLSRPLGHCIPDPDQEPALF